MSSCHDEQAPVTYALREDTREARALMRVMLDEVKREGKVVTIGPTKGSRWHLPPEPGPLVQVLPALQKTSVQRLLRELKAEDKIAPVGRTKAASGVCASPRD